MPVLLDFEQKAYDLKERILELLVSDTITESQAFLLLTYPGTSSDESPGGGGCPQGWHRVFPPLPVTHSILDSLREKGHHLYETLPGRSLRVEEVLSQVESLEQQAQAREDEQRAQAFQALSARSRAGEAVRQQEEGARKGQACSNPRGVGCSHE